MYPNNKKLFLIFLVNWMSASISLATSEMNGIKSDQFGDFSTSWKLVTVRYRQDTHEMRFTYANPIAWEALKKSIVPLPEGSVFAKIGYISSIDPAFESSVVPSGTRRFQYMVKDTKKYPSTNGWGYALFSSDGSIIDNNFKTVTQSCHACHKIVPEKDYVFSEIIETSPLIKNIKKTYSLEKNISKINFVKILENQFKGSLKKYSEEMGLKKIYIVSGPLRNFFFGGTLDEITPALIRQLVNTETASAFVSDEQNTFKILVLADKRIKTDCGINDIAIKIYELRENDEKQKLSSKIICYSKSNI